MRVNAEMVVAAADHYGPFDDGRTIAYVDLVDGAGGGIFRATLAEGVESPPVLARGRADLEFHVRDGKVKSRLHGFDPGK